MGKILKPRIIKIIFVNFLAILTLFGFGISYFTNEKNDTKIPSAMNNKNNSSSSFKKNVHSTSIILQSKISIRREKAKKKTIEASGESQVPWQELNEKWEEELKGFLISISETDGLKMFNSYVDARKIYLKENDKLGEKYQKIQNTTPVDHIKEDQLAVESAEVFKNATQINKRIFGQHFSSVKTFHKEFEESIQVYSRDMPISLDFGFDD